MEFPTFRSIAVLQVQGQAVQKCFIMQVQGQAFEEESLFFSLFDPEPADEALRFFKTSGATYPATQRYIPEGLILQQHRC
jgi:hypothetical protein